MRISCTEYVTNEDVLKELRQKLLNTITKEQLEFLGHVTRKEGLESLTLTRKMEIKRSRGRQRLAYIESLIKSMA